MRLLAIPLVGACLYYPTTLATLYANSPWETFFVIVGVVSMWIATGFFVYHAIKDTK